MFHVMFPFTLNLTRTLADIKKLKTQHEFLAGMSNLNLMFLCDFDGVLSHSSDMLFPFFQSTDKIP